MSNVHLKSLDLDICNYAEMFYLKSLKKSCYQSKGILGFTIYTEVLTHPELTPFCVWYELLVQFKFSEWSNVPSMIYEDSTFLNFSNRYHRIKWKVWWVNSGTKSIYARNYF